METRRMLKLQIRQLEQSNERRIKENKKLKAAMERIENEIERQKAELEDFGPKYRQAMEANRALTDQWEKMKADNKELVKVYKLMERAVEESSRVRKKLSIENRMLMQELEKFGYFFEHADGKLVMHEPQEGAEENEDQC